MAKDYATFRAWEALSIHAYPDHLQMLPLTEVDARLRWEEHRNVVFSVHKLYIDGVLYAEIQENRRVIIGDDVIVFHAGAREKQP